MKDVDLTNLLKDWPYEPGNVNVRLIRATDGRPLIQLRVDLGILQMELVGRPDGQKPEGFPSLLEFHLRQLELAEEIVNAGAPDEDCEDTEGEAVENGVADAGHNPEIGGGGGAAPNGGNDDEDSDQPETEDEDPDLMDENEDDEDEDDADEEPIYIISEEECRAIREEAVQFYHRYIGMYALDEFDAVFDDATHNLGLIDLCRHYGETEDDQEAMEQLRLHTMMTRTRAQAASIAANGNSKDAVAAIDQGLAEIEAFLEAVGVSEDEFGSIGEVQLLNGMRDALIPKLPGSQKMELRERMKAALSAENYELAAILRDEIRMMKD